MASRKLSGVVRVGRNRARLETASALYTLVPYPLQAAVGIKRKQEVGKELFGYLEGQQVVVAGSVTDGTIYNAHLADSGLPVQDVQLAPGSSDRFAQEIAQYLRKDSSEIAAKLNDAGIRTVSALFHRIKNNYKEEVAVFAEYLRVREDRIKEFISAVEVNPDNRALVQASPRFPVMRGVNLALLKGVPVKQRAPSTPPKFPASAVTPELPTKVDLTVHVTAVRNQGLRGTCVAHAAAACLEADLIRKAKVKPKPPLDLSEQYLYWACKSIDAAPNDAGTFIEYAAEVLLNGVAKQKLAGGVCTDKEWPYSRLPNPGNESQGPPPPAVGKMFKANNQHRALNYARLRHNSIKALKKALASGHCVGLSVYTYHFWTDDYAWREGAISLPLSIKPDGAHAICLVGYRDEDQSHRDGYFVFKNSWDTTWGYGRPDPGYGSLPYRYVIKEAIEAYTFDV